MARRLHAAHPRHVQIHDDDVWRDVADDAQRLLPGCRFPDDEHALLLEQVAQPTAKEIVVVDDQDPKVVDDGFLGC